MPADMDPTYHDGCDIWPDDHGPCAAPAVEVLVFCNPRCAGGRSLRVCRAHLSADLRDQLLEVPRA